MQEIVVLGGGMMGSSYLEKLSACPSYSLLVVEPQQATQNSLRERFPAIRVASSLEELTITSPKAVIVTVPPQAHLSILEKLPEIFRGDVRVLCEKPLVIPSDLTRVEETISEFGIGSETHQANTYSLYTGFLCNGSPCFKALVEDLIQNDARLIRIDATWNKDRRGDARHSNGWITDELPHPLAAIVEVCRTLGYAVPQVKSAKAAYDQYTSSSLVSDRSQPLPDSAAVVLLETSRDSSEPAVKIQIEGSYTANQRTRAIRVVWAPGEHNATPLADSGQAEIRVHSVEFDVSGINYNNPNMDRYLYLNTDSQDNVGPSATIKRESTDDKLSLLVAALLSNEDELSLVQASDALEMVRLQRDILDLTCRQKHDLE